MSSARGGGAQQAVAADCIVSGETHLIQLTHSRPRVVTPRQFLINSADSPDEAETRRLRTRDVRR